MVETSSSSTRQDDDRQAFLSYLPERIEAFEQRIRRYSKGGWDHAGMLVLRGDVQRVADTSGRHEMTETQQHLRRLEQSLGDHILRMSRPTQPQTASMLELLSLVTASLPRRFRIGTSFRNPRNGDRVRCTKRWFQCGACGKSVLGTHPAGGRRRACRARP